MLGSTLVDFARYYLGVLYLFGGKAKLITAADGSIYYLVWTVGKSDPKRAPKVPGIDCSGLIYLVCRAKGIPLPHGSYFQARSKWTEPCPLAEAFDLKGVLVFHKNKKGNTDHVGFTVGDGKSTIEANGGLKRVVLRKSLGKWQFARRIRDVDHTR